jgi:hypothetical protein
MLVCLALAILAPGARAESVQFAYSWSMTTLGSTAYGYVTPWSRPSNPSVYMSPDGSQLEVFQGGGLAVLTLPPAGTASLVPGAVAAAIPAGSLEVPRAFSPPDPYTTSVSVGVGLRLHLTDLASGQSGDLNMGRLIDVTYVGSPGLYTEAGNDGWPSPLSLGGHDYTVSVNTTYEQVFPLSGGAPVGFTASVSIGMMKPLPEPSSLALAAGALSLLAVAAARHLIRP